MRYRRTIAVPLILQLVITRILETTSAMKQSHSTNRLLMAFALLATVFSFLADSVDAQKITIDRKLRRAFPEIPKPVDPGKPTSLRYKVKPGDQHTYRLRMDMEMDTMGMVIPKIDEFVIQYEFTSSANNGITFTSQIQEMLSEMRTRGGNLRIDTAHPETEEADPPFKALCEDMEDRS